MEISKLHCIHPSESDHLLQIAQLTAAVFSEGKYIEQYCENYIGNCHYDWNSSRIILDGGKLLHHWGVWGYQMRVESCLLKIGGIGAVVTHEDYRKQGLMYHAAQDSFAAMKQDGYDLSILRGRHYVKMGYSRAWNYVTYHIKFEDFRDLGVPKTYQLISHEQVAEIDALYNQSHASFTGTAIRPTYRNRHPDDIGIYAWRDGTGKIDGYIRALPAEDDPKTLQCLEAVGDPVQGLAVLGELYKQKDYVKVTCFTISHQHPLLQYLRKGACIVEDRYFDISGWRVRIINLHSTLMKIIPLLENRLQHSQFSNWKGSLLLDAGTQKSTLKIAGGKVKATNNIETANILRGGPDIARLLIGSDEPNEIIQQANMVSQGLALPLVSVLFPNTHPMMSHWDEY